MVFPWAHGYPPGKVKIFVTEMAADLALDVPNLSQILEVDKKIPKSWGFHRI